MISLDAKEWLSEVRKPREWTIKRFLARIKVVNGLFTVMSVPEGESDTIPKLTDSELKVILKRVVPKSWNKHVEANYKPTTLEDQARYFEGLRKVESNNNRNDNQQSHPNNNQRNHRNRRDTTSRDRNNNCGGRNNHHRGNNNTLDKKKDQIKVNCNGLCPIHRPSHMLGDCKPTNASKENFKSKK